MILHQILKIDAIELQITLSNNQNNMTLIFLTTVSTKIDKTCNSKKNELYHMDVNFT